MRPLFRQDVIKWRSGQRDRGRVLPAVVNEWSKWVRVILAKYDEFPFGFTEWAVAGHLGIAAGKLGWYVVQEYPVKRRRRGDDADREFRADLYVRSRGSDCVFEVKHVYIKLGWSMAKLEEELRKPLRQARDRLYRYRHIAKYRASIVVGSICIELGKNRNDWKDRHTNRNLYLKAKRELADAFDGLLRELPSSMVNYCGGFLCSHEEARSEYKKGHREGWDPIIGFVYLGRVIPPGRRGR